MITITELLGSNSVAGDRLTINANFLLIENEINDLENTFNINTVTGAMDISTASSGQFKAKSGYFNTIVLPSSGTSSISMYGTGASAGNASFSGTLSTTNVASSGTGTFNILNATGPATFSATGTFSGPLISNASFTNGPTGTNVESNTASASGSGAPFLGVNLGGGGVTGTFSSPYVLSGQESVVYANCSFVSGATADASNATGFFFQVAGASGATASVLPSGYKITIVHTGASAGIIGTGITGPNTTGYYYTGFNTSAGQYQTAGITVPAKPYKASVNLMWEPRIAQTSSTMKGSWVVLGSSSITF